MKNLILIITFFISINLYSQNLQTYQGTYNIDSKNGDASFTYFSQNGERIIDGNFSFNCPSEKTTINGKYLKGKKTGLWTTTRLYSTFNGLGVVKEDLRWYKVLESMPFKESKDVTIENWQNDKLNGLSTSTKIVKNSWGYPNPGGSSIVTYIVKKNYIDNVLSSIEATRKKNEKTDLSLKGYYKNDLVDGNWLFKDNKNSCSYTFINGSLTNYEIKELGTNKLIDSGKNEVDNNYFKKSDNTFEILTNYDSYDSNKPEMKDAKISIEKINENLSIIKFSLLKKEITNFIGLNANNFKNAFGQITPYEVESSEVFGFSPTYINLVATEKDYDSLLGAICFKDVETEFAFLNYTTNSKGQFLNTDWGKISTFSTSRLFFQLKSFLYKGDITGLKEFLALTDSFSINFNNDKNANINMGNSEIQFNDYLRFLIYISLGEKEYWKEFIDNTYNGNSQGKTWQAAILNQLTEIQSSTSFVKPEINDAINYLKSKDDEIKQMNNDAISNIKELKLGTQVWMATDLNITPFNPHYNLVIDNKIQDKKVGKVDMLT